MKNKASLFLRAYDTDMQPNINKEYQLTGAFYRKFISLECFYLIMLRMTQEGHFILSALNVMDLDTKGEYRFMMAWVYDYSCALGVIILLCRQ